MKRRGQWQQHYVGKPKPESLAPLKPSDPLKAPFFAVGPELVRR